MDSRLTRREFVRAGSLGGTALAVGVGTAEHAAAAVSAQAVVAAMGDTLIPTADGDPGYRSLESHGITGEVLKGLAGAEADLELFDAASAPLNGGKRFSELGEAARGGYFEAVAAGKVGSGEEAGRLQRIFRRVRQRVFEVYYSNFPEHSLPRDGSGVPVLPAGDQHQITNPNTRALVTGWDVAGFAGPLSWEEEERRRQLVKSLDWKE